MKAANHAGFGRYQLVEWKLAPTADMACHPWIVLHERQGQDLNDFTHLKRWYETIENREAVKRAYALADRVNPDRSGMSEEAKKILFGQGRRIRAK